MVRQSARRFFHKRKKHLTERQISRREFLKKAGVLVGGTAAVGALIGGPRIIKREVGKRTIFLEDNGVARAKQWADRSFSYSPWSFRRFPLSIAEMKSLNRIIEKAGIKGEMGGNSEVERVLRTLMADMDKKTIEQFKMSSDATQRRIAIVWEEFNKLPTEQKYNINKLIVSMQKKETF